MIQNIAFVPARIGSQSIPQKNIKLFCGKPLIFWCLDALEKASSVDKIVVATDSNKISEAVNSFNFSKTEIFERSDENATNDASTESVMLEYLDQLKTEIPEYFTLVQATNPFVTSSDFDEAFSNLIKSERDSLLTCCRLKRFIWDESGVALNYDYKARPRRQDFEGQLVENGAFYINKTSNILRDQNRLSGEILIHTMPEHSFIELDEKEDWLVGENLMRKILSQNQHTKIKVFLSDVDGVLTDAGMYYTEKGDEIKKFSTYDGVGFEILKENGIKVGIMTAEDRELNRRRAAKLKLDYDFHGIKDKLSFLYSFCKENNLEMSEIGYIGDERNDYDVLGNVGVAVCPSNAIDSIKNIPGIIKLNTSGGNGVLRELVNEHLNRFFEK